MNNNRTRQESELHRIVLLAAICLLVAGAALYRVILIEETRLESDLQGDGVDYFMYAYNLSNSGIYSQSRDLQQGGEAVVADANRPPLFPLAIAPWIKSGTRAEIETVYYLNLWAQVIGLLMLSLILVSKLQSWWVLLPIALACLHPHLAILTTNFLSESLFTALILAALFFVFLHEKREVLSALVLAGFCIGLASITRGSMQYYWFFLLLLALCFRQERRYFFCFIIASLVPLLAWETYKQLYVSNPGNLQIIATLYHGHFPDFRFGGIEESYGFAYRYDPLRDYAMASVPNTLEIIWLRIKQAPLSYLYWYTIGKQAHLWQWSIIAGYGGPFVYPPVASPFLEKKSFQMIVSASYYIHWPVVLAGLAGMCVALTAIIREKLRPFSVYGFSALLLIYIILIHALAAPYPRYAIPFYPFLLVMNCYLVTFLLEQIRDREIKVLFWRY